jgi:pSer/pThr/pTyr-binding forkhead associated (FHA) protein
MAQEPQIGAEEDPDKTDTLPALAGPAAPRHAEEGGLLRGGRLDLPKLAAKMRSVEEHVARQAAEYTALSNKLERVQDSEAAAVARATALAVELTSVRAAFEAERDRNRESERALYEKIAGNERARVRIEERPAQTAALEERIAALTREGQTLTQALAARDATILQVLNSLAERDAQLTALQREHASIVPDLEARVQAGQRLTGQLEAAETRIGTLQLELDRRAATIETLATRLARAESELADGVRELKAARAQSTAYLEVLQSQEWRRSYEHSRWQQPDAAPQALQTALVALESQRDELKRKHAELAAAQESITTTARAGASTPSPIANERAEPPDAEAGAARDAERVAEIAALKTALATAQEEVTVLLAHLQAARRQEPESEAAKKEAAERKQLAVELAARIARIAALEQENRELHASLERTRGALDEREFLIRRLERSETSNASALGRLQNTIERLGDVAAPEASLPAIAAVEAAVTSAREMDTGHPEGANPEGAPGKLVRVDGGHAVTYVLQRRNQVGRAPGTEVHIDSSTVSRLHALIVSAPGGAIIEDVKSTNGTYVNGQRVTRQRLRDGDLLTIGEAQFRFVAETRRKPPVDPNPPPAPASEGPAAG